MIKSKSNWLKTTGIITIIIFIILSFHLTLTDPFKDEFDKTDDISEVISVKADEYAQREFYATYEEDGRKDFSLHSIRFDIKYVSNETIYITLLDNCEYTGYFYSGGENYDTLLKEAGTSGRILITIKAGQSKCDTFGIYYLLFENSIGANDTEITIEGTTTIHYVPTFTSSTTRSLTSGLGVSSIGILLLIIVHTVIIQIIKRRKSKLKQAIQSTPQHILSAPKTKPSPVITSSTFLPTHEEKIINDSDVTTPSSVKLKEGIKIKTAINFEKAHVIYKVKIENVSESPIAKIKIKPYLLNDVFIMEKDEDDISLLEVNNAQTVTFKLRPRGECGDVFIGGKVKYYDMAKQEFIDKEIRKKLITIICPLLKVKKITDNEWKRIVSKLIKIEETTEEIPIGGRMLMTILSSTIRDLNFYMLYPSINETASLYRAKMKFYSEGQGGLHYAIILEIIGGHNKSKLIIKNYANTEEALTGCYHKILDEIEKRIKIKQYLTEGTIHVHGDYIAGDKKEIRDSVIHRSNL